MEVAFFTEEEKQTVLKNLKEILRLHAEMAKKENQEIPISNADFITRMKISPRTAQNWRDIGIIEYFKIGEKIYYHPDAIKRMWENHKIKSFK